jgi:tRNA (guanine37-N1)-methyltransferase
MSSRLWFGVVSVLPEMVAAYARFGVTGRAIADGRVDVACFDPRAHVDDRHRTIDDRPYGGGPGMVMMAEPVAAAIDAARRQRPAARVLALTPQGRLLDAAAVRTLHACRELVLVAGRYEGIDERAMRLVDEEWSIGDYVLSGGELPALVLMEAIIRLEPGVLGDAASAAADSFVDGLLDCPHYTRPETIARDGRAETVPEVLLSGNHAAIRRWRLAQSLGRTWERRRELIPARGLSDEERDLLDAYIRDRAGGATVLRTGI